MLTKRLLPLVLSASVIFLALACLANATLTPARAAADLVIYGDALAADWGDWSWDTSANLNNPSPTHSGSASIAATYLAGWGGLYLG
ncbi:MAG TPA: hypothetical protein PKM21_17610, partial [Anaerolineales bacterium]|nr:hypothetical protein [Anaerolineales bacterium]